MHAKYCKNTRKWYNARYVEERKQNMQQRAYRATRTFLRLWRSKDVVTRERPTGQKRRGGVQVAFIYGEKRVATGADHINRLMAHALAARGARVRAFYPRLKLRDTPSHLKGIANILFFHSLLEHKNEILKNDIIQGTTYTPLPFLTFNIPVVSHFGSTTRGFLLSTPATAKLPAREKSFYKGLFKLGIINEMDFKTFRPLEDAADIEELVATQADACIATSKKVKEELIVAGVPEERIHVIHNAIEDYWFAHEPVEEASDPHLIFLGRLGGDVFTLKLKGLARLNYIYNAFPDVLKTTICMTVNKPLKNWMRVAFPRHYMFVNLRRDLIPNVLRPRFGSILLLTSRYEGFSLSMVEGMSQGIVPVSFPVGVAPEVIRNGENGFLVSSSEEAQERIQYLLDHKEERLAMARAARETAQSFRSDKISQQLLELYQVLRGARRKEQQQQQASV